MSRSTPDAPSHATQNQLFFESVIHAHLSLVFFLLASHSSSMTSIIAPIDELPVEPAAILPGLEAPPLLFDGLLIYYCAFRWLNDLAGSTTGLLFYLTKKYSKTEDSEERNLAGTMTELSSWWMPADKDLGFHSFKKHINRYGISVTALVLALTWQWLTLFAEDNAMKYFDTDSQQYEDCYPGNNLWTILSAMLFQSPPDECSRVQLSAGIAAIASPTALMLYVAKGADSLYLFTHGLYKLHQLNKSDAQQTPSNRETKEIIDTIMWLPKKFSIERPLLATALILSCCSQKKARDIGWDGFSTIMIALACADTVRHIYCQPKARRSQEPIPDLNDTTDTSYTRTCQEAWRRTKQHVKTATPITSIAFIKRWAPAALGFFLLLRGHKTPTMTTTHADPFSWSGLHIGNMWPTLCDIFKPSPYEGDADYPMEADTAALEMSGTLYLNVIQSALITILLSTTAITIESSYRLIRSLCQDTPIDERDDDHHSEFGYAPLQGSLVVAPQEDTRCTKVMTWTDAHYLSCLSLIAQLYNALNLFLWVPQSASSLLDTHIDPTVFAQAFYHMPTLAHTLQDAAFEQEEDILSFLDDDDLIRELGDKMAAFVFTACCQSLFLNTLEAVLACAFLLRLPIICKESFIAVKKAATFIQERHCQQGFFEHCQRTPPSSPRNETPTGTGPGGHELLHP